MAANEFGTGEIIICGSKGPVPEIKRPLSKLMAVIVSKFALPSSAAIVAALQSSTIMA
jgi:hypothetical protein